MVPIIWGILKVDRLSSRTYAAANSTGRRLFEAPISDSIILCAAMTAYLTYNMAVS